MGIMPLLTPFMMVNGIQPAPVADRAPPAAPGAAGRLAAMIESKRSAAAEAASAEGVDRAPAASGMETDGDALLTGLQRLRHVFNDQESRIASLMSGAQADTETLLAMQMELTNFSLLIDMTSKLSSKAAQGLDTLLKGS